MKTFKQYILEEPSVIPGAGSIDAQPKPYHLPKDAIHIGTSVVGDETFHFYKAESYDGGWNDGNHEGFIAKQVGNEHHVVGDVGFTLNNGENKFSASGPRLRKEHRKKGLMSELYIHFANSMNMPLVSHPTQTKGASNVWHEVHKKTGSVYLWPHRLINSTQEHKDEEVLYNPEDKNHQRQALRSRESVFLYRPQTVEKD